jgi:carboxypeptidase Taq
LQKHFPSQLGEIDMDGFYRAINKVQPSLIRVEADEVSYNLHIILRFELEVEVIEGRMAVRDLPEAWNEKMRAYLGIVPIDVARGVLQDVHWSVGMVGHFSTYALGNIIASQFWARMGEDLPERETDLAQGNVTPVLAWLREQVHQHGRKYPPAELVRRITGEPINTRPYLDYLQHKFGEMYALT